jgi:hypothetical protein
MRYQLQILSQWGMSYSIDLCVLFSTIAIYLTCLAYRMGQNKDYALQGCPLIYIICSVIPRPICTDCRLGWSSFSGKCFGIFKVFEQMYSPIGHIMGSLCSLSAVRPYYYYYCHVFLGA